VVKGEPVSYYRAFVQDFTYVARPHLNQEEVPFVWDDNCEAAFLQLKKQLTSAPILVAPRDEGTYILDTDASDTALGAVLQQEQLWSFACNCMCQSCLVACRDVLLYHVQAWYMG